MGRIVYFSFPAHGHINPTLPVIRELIRSGQQVAYYSTDKFRQGIEGTGALFCPYSTQFSMPEQGPGPFARLSTTLETLLELSRVVLDGHLEQAKMLRPTHIMHDSFAPWGRFVAQLLRLPSIASVPSILVNGDIDSRYGAGQGVQSKDPRLTPQWYAAFRSCCQAGLARYSLPAFQPPQLLQSYGDLNVVYTSRLFQPLAEAFDERRFKFVGPCFGFRPEAPPFPFARLDGQPLVLVSLGTVYGNHPQFFRMCFEELAGAPCQVVVSAGGNLRTGLLGPIPENFIVRAFVPQVELLRRCAAFVTHGGMNGVQEALYYGVPMAVAPQGADQFWISARASELGAAVVLCRMRSGAIREGVERILSSTLYAAAAARIGASLRAAGGERKAAGEIRSFISRGAHAGATAG
jgi:MGT family glycosyltransferase